MSRWLADVLWDALKLFAGKVHDWFFDPQRAARGRFKDRERWWAYKCKAEQTKDPRDDMRAEWWRIRFDFKTSPDEAVERGDLTGRTKQGTTA